MKDDLDSFLPKYILEYPVQTLTVDLCVGFVYAQMRSAKPTSKSSFLPDTFSVESKSTLRITSGYRSPTFSRPPLCRSSREVQCRWKCFLFW